MIIDVTKLKERYPELTNVNADILKEKLTAIEIAIRSYTHNNFQNKQIKALGNANGNTLTFQAGTWLFRVGDTVQLSDNGLNDGLYTILSVNPLSITVDAELYTNSNVLIAKVQYPQDIIEGAINLLKWDVKERGKKEGIASESISRHSVSYVSYNNSNTINGYPSHLFGFTRPYRKMRT